LFALHDVVARADELVAEELDLALQRLLALHTR
jgi:hypothetical protein